MKPLQDITVVELTTYWAATTTGRFLRSLGARVIRIETPPKGDACRYFGMAYHMPITAEENPIHDMYNGGKECLALDLTQPENREIVYNMLEKADVFLTSTREKGLKKLGLDWETIKEKFPHIVMAHATGWGKDGPMSGMPGIDAISFFGMNGILTDLRMDENTPPIYSPTGMGDLTTGTMLAVGTLAALHARELTGKGDYVMCSLYGSGNWVTSAVSCATQYGYEWPRNPGNSGPMGQAYTCKDGRNVFLFVNEYDKFWNAFVEAFGLEDIKDNPKYNTRVAALVPENRKELVEIVMERAKQRTAQEIFDVLKANDVPSCILAKFKDKYEGEQLEQNVLNGYLAEHTYPSGKSVYLSQMPIYFDSQGVQDLYERHRALGEDNEALIKEFSK